MSSLPGSFDGLVCDLDGVVYRGDESIAGAAEAVAELRAMGVTVLFATNNATASVEEFERRLGAFGIPAAPDDILTSGVVTAEEIVAREWTDLPALVVGGPGIRQALGAVGVGVVGTNDWRAARMVVVATDWNLTYEDLKAATLALRAGAHFIATNEDKTFPAPDGLWPGAGAIVAALTVASDRAAEVMGKPHAPMMKAAAARLEGCSSIAIIGDQPATDLAGGRELGWTTILVLSGVTASAEGLEPAPDVVLPSIADLAALLSSS